MNNNNIKLRPLKAGEKILPSDFSARIAGGSVGEEYDPGLHSPTYREVVCDLCGGRGGVEMGSGEPGTTWGAPCPSCSDAAFDYHKDKQAAEAVDILAEIYADGRGREVYPVLDDSGTSSPLFARIRKALLIKCPTCGDTGYIADEPGSQYCRTCPTCGVEGLVANVG